MSKSSDRKRLTDLGSPHIPINALWIVNGNFFDISLFVKDNKKSGISSNLINRTSLAGVALDSATSSGLGRAPRSAMQNPIQAPPGTTRQAGLYTKRDYRAARTCWSVVWSGKEEKEKWNDKKRVENREGSLGYPRFVKPVFTKHGRPFEEIEKDH
ncbi:hypothetical protein TNCV_4999281 [Trichonephila clavipes]|nr:hypothetical protein TNCV_4999281 [Trichonephila clavipes]